MKIGLQILGGGGAEGRKIRLAGNPLAILLLIAVLLWLALFARSAVNFAWDHYSPYRQWRAARASG